MVTENKSRAETAASGRGWYGGTADIQKRKGIKVDDNVYLLDVENASEIPLGIDLIKETKNKKKRALAKLTKEEKGLLGVEDDDDDDDY